MEQRGGDVLRKEECASELITCAPPLCDVCWSFVACSVPVGVLNRCCSWSLLLAPQAL